MELKYSEHNETLLFLLLPPCVFRCEAEKPWIIRFHNQFESRFLVHFDSYEVFELFCIGFYPLSKCIIY